MAARRKNGGVSPTLLAYGRMVRRYRNASGLTQDRLGTRLPCKVTGSYIGLVEAGKSRCTKENAVIMDQELDANGVLVTLWDDLVMDSSFPIWFDWPSVESEATMLQSYSLSVVHGLLQISVYASAVLHGDKEAVEARLKRQSILTREDPPPPTFSLLLDESALYRETGSPEIMREQLEYLIEVSQLPNVTIQIVPMRGEHGGNSGSFNIATLADRSEVAYADSAARGLTLSDPEELETMSKTLIELRSLALPVSQSIALIRKVVEEKWT